MLKLLILRIYNRYMGHYSPFKIHHYGSTCLSLMGIIATTFLVGCSSSHEPKQEFPAAVATPAPSPSAPPKITAKPPKVALLVPLSGPHAEMGRSLQQAAELSLFQEAQQEIELLIRDTRGTAEGARAAAQSIKNAGARIVLGPLLAHEVTAVTSVLQNSTIPILAFSNNRAVANRQVFTLGYAPAEQIERVGRYAAKQNIKNIIVFVPQDEYGSLVLDIFKNLQNQGLLQVIAQITYDPKKPGDIPTLSAANVQGFFFAEGGVNLNQLLEALQKQNVRLADFKLMGSSQWDHPLVVNNPKLAGGFFVSTDPQERKDFEMQYEHTYQTTPPRLASLAYDAVSLVSVLIKMNKEQPFALSNLLQSQGFLGSDGVFRLKADGTVERGLAIQEITGAGSRVVDPAPKRF